MRLAQTSIFVILFSVAVIGQTNKGAITGSVTDPQGAAVPGATVTITNINTSQSVTVVTSREGIFASNNLDPTEYDITIEANSFKRAIVEKVKVNTASSSTINVVLELGNINEEVTIAADAQLVNSDSGTLTQTITERQLRDLPLNNRSVLDLAVTMPNVSGDSGSEDVDAGFGTPMPGFNLSVNGGRPGAPRCSRTVLTIPGGLARAFVVFRLNRSGFFRTKLRLLRRVRHDCGGVINITTKSAQRTFSVRSLVSHAIQNEARCVEPGLGPASGE